jgi:hypothetical protein
VAAKVDGTVGRWPKAQSLVDAGRLQINNARNYRAARIEGQILKSPPALEGPYAVVDRPFA